MTPLFKSSLIVYAVLGFTAQALCQRPPSSEQPQSAVSVTVTDSAGARVCGAEVTITSQSSGVTVNERTNGKGQVVVKLPKDDYSVKATSAGFKWTMMTNVHVQPPAPIQLSLELHPGEKHTDY